MSLSLGNANRLAVLRTDVNEFPDTPYLLSTTMVTLVRLTLSDPRTSQADDAIWQLAVFNLRRFLSTLSRTRDDAEWDPADLALSRAHYFVPLLAKKVSPRVARAAQVVYEAGLR